jgi:hypothetical protein
MIAVNPSSGQVIRGRHDAPLRVGGWAERERRSLALIGVGLGDLQDFARVMRTIERIPTQDRVKRSRVKFAGQADSSERR